MGCAERRYRHHGVVGSSYEEEVKILLVGPVGSFCLDVHSVYAVEHIEVVDIYRSGESFHCGEDVAYRDALHFGLVAVHIEV